MTKTAFLRSATVSALALTTASLGNHAAAWAQDTSPEAAAEGSPGEEIIVTGSRIARTSFNAPTPVNVVGQDRVQNLNISSVGDALNQIPSFRPLTTPSTNSFRANSNIAGRSLDLRGLGPTRTLTMIDGRRNVPSGDENTFDLNSIPSILIQRSEVVTGGASAAYGADAVAGVVNLILDTKFSGVKGELSYGISQRSDVRNVYGTVAAGTGFAGGRGHVIVGLEYSDEGGTGDFNSRKWSARYHSFIPNPFFSTDPTKSNGLPANVAIDNVLYVLNPAGLIASTHALQGYQFDNSGNLVPFQFGELFNRARPSNLMVGGDPSVQDIYGFNKTPLVVPTHHISALGHAEYELTDTITASAEVSYARVVGGPTAGANYSDQNGTLRINRDNAYLTPQTAAMMDAAKVTFLPLNRADIELGNSVYKSFNKTWRANFALKGEIGNWHWDGFYDFGQTKGRLEGYGIRLEQRWKDAVDAVFVTALNRGTSGLPIGSIVCRSTLTAPTNGCIPTNVMGAGTVNAATAAWVRADAWQTRTFTQHHLGANLRGTLFQGWAGPIAVATGMEYRTNAAEGDADANSQARNFQAVNATVLPSLTQKVVEGYGEINVPIFKDSAIGKSLEIDGAIRRTHYSLSGSATTWKVGAVYELNDEYMIRVTRSHDIRAPSPLEQNPNVRVQNLSQADPKLGIQYIMPAVIGGNPDLRLEKANTFTIGAVFKPNWFPRFRLSVDYYDIKVSDAIDIISIPLAVSVCRAGTYPEVCTIGTDAAGNPDRILQLRATYQNVNQLRARGFEFVSSYSLPILSGDMNFSINANYIDTLSTTLPDGSVQEFADVTGNSGSVTTIFGVPKWKADAVITYERPTWAVTTQLRYIPKGILNRNWVGPQDDGYSPYLANSVSDNRIAGRLYVNLNAKIKLFGEDKHKIELFGGINNLFDKDPPSNLRYTGNGLYFDPVGRAFKIGVRADW